MTQVSLYDITGDIKDINTLLVQKQVFDLIEKDAARMQWIVENDVQAAEMLATTSGTFIRDQIDSAIKEQK